MPNRTIGRPWRHLLGQHCLLDGFGPGTRVVISQQRHWRSLAWAMTVLTAGLEDGFDVLVKGKLRVSGMSHEGHGQRDHKESSSVKHLLHRIHPAVVRKSVSSYIEI